MNNPAFQQKSFFALLITVSIAFIWVLLPFYGAVFWGTVLAILFTPFYRQLLAGMRGRRNLAALTTLFLVLVIVIFPMSVITMSLVKEVNLVVQMIRTGQLDFGAYFLQIINALPPWAVEILDRYELGTIYAIRERLSEAALQGSQLFASQALNIGQNTFHFVVSFAIMLYLLFFLLRDGATLSARIRHAIPLSEEHKRLLISKFTTVIRATVKGNIVVAVTQGALGGLIFWILGIQGALLWAVLMAFLSLLPAVGASLIWGPVAIYFLVTGAVWQGVVLIAFGVFVIGLVDNILRPILVGKDTKLPDYVVLISTLGGMALFGLNGFVIGPLIAALFIAAWDLLASTREARAE
ncbi:MAG TPA: AI-2E family transporter [Noviherbaspirillum sp.]|nr:AI-2E family transporter [Noviherbaspirillum sp.]